MKHSSLRRAIAAGFLGTALLAACDPTGPSERVAIMDIASQRVACVGVGPMQCLQVRQHPDTAWSYFYDGIEGFTFEPGFEYTLRVGIRDVPNPPADGSSLAYRMLALLRKEPAP